MLSWRGVCWMGLSVLLLGASQPEGCATLMESVGPILDEIIEPNPDRAKIAEKAFRVVVAAIEFAEAQRTQATDDQVAETYGSADAPTVVVAEGAPITTELEGSRALTSPPNPEPGEEVKSTIIYGVVGTDANASSEVRVVEKRLLIRVPNDAPVRILQSLGEPREVARTYGEWESPVTVTLPTNLEDGTYAIRHVVHVQGNTEQIVADAPFFVRWRRS